MSVPAQNNHDLQALARRRLPHGLYEYVARGSEEEATLRHNRASLDAIRLRPRVFADVSTRNLACTVLGRNQSMPLAIAPTGSAGLMWYQGELALARAAERAGIPFTVSTSSLTSLEDIARASQGRLWFQLYVWPDFSTTRQLVERAQAAGYDTLIVTADTVVTPNREYNSRNGFNVPIRFHRRNIADVALHPRWLAGVFLRYLATSGMPQFENYPDALRTSLRQESGKQWTVSKKAENLQWTDLSRLRDLWKGSLVVKGILHPDDACAALRHGADAIVVSNHGGRNLDGVPAPLEVLPAIRAAIGEDATVLVDSGFMRGSDVVKALALGANSVMVGRAPLYGVAAAGEAGASRCLDIFRTEMDRVLAFMGVADIAQLGPQHVQPLRGHEPAASVPTESSSPSPERLA